LIGLKDWCEIASTNGIFRTLLPRVLVTRHKIEYLIYYQLDISKIL
jgi:hypothetical protein